jgi:hypothetical protein
MGIVRKLFVELIMTTITFADYAAAAEARKDIATAVLGHTYALCEALRQNFIDYSIKSHKRSLERLVDISDSEESYHLACIQDLKNGNCGYEFYPETGRKYHKIIMNASGSRSVHCFIDKKTGQVYKSASWKAPAKGVRYDLRIIEQREWLLENADWAGKYLYLK